MPPSTATRRTSGVILAPRSQSYGSVAYSSLPVFVVSAPPATARRQRLDEAHGGLEVELHVALHVGPAGVGERAPPGRARVVDQQVQTSMLLLHAGQDLGPRLGPGQVAGDDQPAPELAGQTVQA